MFSLKSCPKSAGAGHDEDKVRSITKARKWFIDPSASGGFAGRSAFLRHLAHQVAGGRPSAPRSGRRVGRLSEECGQGRNWGLGIGQVGVRGQAGCPHRGPWATVGGEWENVDEPAGEQRRSQGPVAGGGEGTSRKALTPSQLSVHVSGGRREGPPCTVTSSHTVAGAMQTDRGSLRWTSHLPLRREPEKLPRVRSHFPASDAR